MGPSSRHHCRPLLLLLPTLSRNQLPSLRLSLSPNLRLRPSPVTITVQTLWSPSRSRAQRENQSRSPTVDLATPSSAPLPPSSSLSSLPSLSKNSPRPNVTNIIDPILSVSLSPPPPCTTCS